jgi:hypothetical protein
LQVRAFALPAFPRQIRNDRLADDDLNFTVRLASAERRKVT